MLLIFFLLIIIDFIYLLLIKNKFNKMIYNIQHSKIKPKLLSIICCYILISIGIY